LLPGRRANSVIALRHVLNGDNAAVLLKLGHGSFFRDHTTGWDDIDLIFLLDDTSGFRKSRFTRRGETFDISWCGVGGLQVSLHAAAVRGRQFLACSLANSMLLHGDERAFRTDRRTAINALQQSLRSVARQHLLFLRYRITMLLDDIAKGQGEQRKTLCLELQPAILELVALSRDEWIVSRAYEDEWSRSLTMLANVANETLGTAMAGFDVDWIALVRRGLEGAGGDLRDWPPTP
jgi:hypothetical protein